MISFYRDQEAVIVADTEDQVDTVQAEVGVDIVDIVIVLVLVDIALVVDSIEVEAIIEEGTRLDLHKAAVVSVIEPEVVHMDQEADSIIAVQEATVVVGSCPSWQ